MVFTVHDAKRYTASLIASLKEGLGREFTASELESRTKVPKKFVRRALTKDAENEARSPIDGVTLVPRDGRWYYSWTGLAAGPAPPEKSK